MYWVRCRWPSLGNVLTYVVVTMIGITSFFFLHYLGNQIPYELAAQRLDAEFRSNRPDVGTVAYFGGSFFKNSFEYCQTSHAVLGGAKKVSGGGSTTPIIDAILLKTFQKIGPDYCDGVRMTIAGAELNQRILKAHYWWGSKALFAIALNYFSVFEIRQFIRFFTYAAYMLLGLLVWRCLPSALPVILPVIAFGIFFSGIRYFSDVTNGIPYLWSITAAAVLVLVMRVGVTTTLPPATVFKRARMFCFIMGLVSCYLWLFDMHTILATTLIGLLAYFGYSHLDFLDRRKFAFWCIFLYLAGFTVCAILRQSITIITHELVSDYYNYIFVHLREVVILRLQGIQFPKFLFLENFWAMVGPSSPTGAYELLNHTLGASLTLISVAAFVGALGSAFSQARHGFPGLLRDIQAVIAITVFVYLQYLLPNDLPFRSGRFIFVFHALSWSCLLLAVVNRWHQRKR